MAVRLYRDGIVDAFRGDPRFRVVGSAASLSRARLELDALPARADIALVDLEVAEGVDAVRELRRDWPSTAIVALAVREVDDEVVRWVEAGVSGLVTRDATLAQVLDVVEAAANDEVLCTPSVAAALFRRIASLSSGHAVGGAPAPDASRARDRRTDRRRPLEQGDRAQLHIELATVKNHVHNILEKLHVGRRIEAMTAARARGELGRI